MNEIITEIKHNGKKIKLNNQYTYVGEFVNGFCKVAIGKPFSNHRFGYINEEGIEVIKPRFVLANDFHCGVAVVMTSKSDYTNLKHSVIDEEGKEIIDTKKQIYGQIWDFEEDMGAVRTHDCKYGYINTKGEEVITSIYYRMTDFREGIVACNKFNEPYWVYLNKSGEEIFRIKCQKAYEFFEGLAVVREKEKKYYYINKKGERVSPYYEHALKFSEGLAAVKVNNKYGFINQNFDYVIMPKFDFYDNTFENGYAKVSLDDDIFYINKNGNKEEKPKVLIKK